MAVVYAVGVGPGDPELLTRKAERILRSVDVICAPTGAAEGGSYALSIVDEFIDRSRQEVLVQLFPMVKDMKGLDPYWEEAADQVAQRVAQGKDVAFVTIGDPFLYSTYLYIHRIFLAKYPEIKIEVVPGISSILASSAVSGLPLGLGAERIAILPATYEKDELKRTLEEFDTVVLMKVNRVFDAVYAALKELGREKSGVFVRRVGSADEEVHHDLEALLGRKLDYLSMLIVRKNPL